MARKPMSAQARKDFAQRMANARAAKRGVGATGTAAKGKTAGGVQGSQSKGRSNANRTGSNLGTGSRSLGNTAGGPIKQTKGRAAQVRRTRTGGKGTAAIGSVAGFRSRRQSGSGNPGKTNFGEGSSAATNAMPSPNNPRQMMKPRRARKQRYLPIQQGNVGGD
jgi:hypothetical protein